MKAYLDTRNSTVSFEPSQHTIEVQLAPDIVKSIKSLNELDIEQLRYFYEELLMGEQYLPETPITKPTRSISVVPNSEIETQILPNGANLGWFAAKYNDEPVIVETFNDAADCLVRQENPRSLAKSISLELIDNIYRVGIRILRCTVDFESYRDDYSEELEPDFEED